MRHWAACACGAGLASAALGQSAVMRVSHNDPDGIVEPGQTVRIAATISWQNAAVFWEIAGAVRATGDAGAASNSSFPYNVPLFPPGRVIEPGSAVGGSMADVHIYNGDAAFLGGWPLGGPWAQLQGLHITQFDWTAPASAGIVDFGWEPSAVLPQPTMFLSMTTYSVAPISTSYIGTSLTVVPGMGSAWVLAAGVGVMGRRRR